MPSEVVSLYRIVSEWFRTSQMEGLYSSWIFDEGMIWKPYHRYWFAVNDTNVEIRDSGSINPNYSVEPSTFPLQAADPLFFEKLGQLLIIRS